MNEMHKSPEFFPLICPSLPRLLLHRKVRFVIIPVIVCAPLTQSFAIYIKQSFHLLINQNIPYELQYPIISSSSIYLLCASIGVDCWVESSISPNARLHDI